MCKMIAYDNQWFYDQHHIKKGGFYAFALYGMLQYFKTFGVDTTTLISIDALRESMMMNEENRTYIKHLKMAFKYLHDNKMIEFHDRPINGERIVINIDMIKGKTQLYVKLVNLPERNMTLIKCEEMDKILFNDEVNPSQKLSLYGYFGVIASHINTYSKVAFPSLNRLMDIAGIGSTNTCAKYNDKLVKLGVIIYGNAGTKRKTNSEVTGETNGLVSNTYARPEHKVELQQEIVKLQDKQRADAIVATARENTNKQVSYKLKYIHASNRYNSATTDEQRAKEKAEMDLNADLYYKLTGKHPKD